MLTQSRARGCVIGGSDFSLQLMVENIVFWFSCLLIIIFLSLSFSIDSDGTYFIPAFDGLQVSTIIQNHKFFDF